MRAFKTSFHELALRIVPDGALPCPLSDIVESAETYYDNELDKWRDCPEDYIYDPDADEKTVIILNDIAQEISKKCGRPLTRKYTTEVDDAYSHDEKRVPILAIVPIDYVKKEANRDCYEDVVQWELLMAYVYCSSRIASSKDALLCAQSFLEYARYTFSSQNNRNYLLILVFSDTNLYLFLYDRSGVVVSEKIDITKDKEGFLRMMIGLLFAPEKHLGYDPTIKTVNGKRTVTVKNHDGQPIELEIKETIHRSSLSYGQGMTIWRACGHPKNEDNEQVMEREFIVRDYWVEEKHLVNGMNRLEKIEGLSNVARVWLHEDMGERTKDFRQHGQLIYASKCSDGISLLNNDECDYREHHRCVLDTIGRPIHKFNSLEELVHAFLDIFLLIIDMYAQHRVLHRDINPTNLLLVNTENGRKCFLVDSQCTVNQTDECAPERLGERVGSLPFMAYDMLNKRHDHSVFEHRYYHDLESTYYTLIWMCLEHSRGLYKNRMKNMSDSNSDSDLDDETRDDSIIHKWDRDPLEWEDTYYFVRKKAAVMRYRDSFHSSVIDLLAPRYENIKNYLTELWKFMSPRFAYELLIPDLYRDEEIARLPPLYQAHQVERDIDAVRQEIYEIHMRAIVFLQKEKNKSNSAQADRLYENQTIVEYPLSSRQTRASVPRA